MNENPPVLSPQEVWGKQLDNLKKFGYPLPGYDVIGMEVPLPDSEKLKLGPALLVDYETPIFKQCQLLDIKNYLKFSYHRNLRPKPQGRWAWIYGVEDGTGMLDKTESEADNEFRKNHRRGLKTIEGLALYREDINFLKHHYVDLSGSRYTELGGRVSHLSLDADGRPSLHGGWSARASSKWGSASCMLEQ